MPDKAKPAAKGGKRQTTRDQIPEDQKVVAALHEIADLLTKMNRKLTKIRDNTGKGNSAR